MSHLAELLRAASSAAATAYEETLKLPHSPAADVAYDAANALYDAYLDAESARIDAMCRT